MHTCVQGGRVHIPKHVCRVHVAEHVCRVHVATRICVGGRMHIAKHVWGCPIRVVVGGGGKGGGRLLQKGCIKLGGWYCKSS